MKKYIKYIIIIVIIVSLIVVFNLLFKPSMDKQIISYLEKFVG